MSRRERFSASSSGGRQGIQWRVLSLIAAMSLVLAACGGATDEGDDEQADAAGDAADANDNGDTDPATDDDGNDPLAGSSFSFIYPVAEAGESPYQAAVDDYLEAFPERNVQAENIPTDRLGQTLRTRFQGGNPPTLMYVTAGRATDYSVLPFAEAGFLEPITGTSAEDLIPEGAEDLLSVDGDLYGQPFDRTIVATVTNYGQLGEDGVEIPQDFDRLLDLCPSVADADKSVVVVGASAPPNAGQFGLALAGSRVYANTPDWNERRHAGEVTFADSQEWQQTLQAVLDLQEAGCLNPGVEAAHFADITNRLGQGTSYMAFIPAGAAFQLQAEVPDSVFRVHAWPGATEDSTVVFASPNNNLAVAAQADESEKEAALAFLEWLAQPENLAGPAAVGGLLPAIGLSTDELPEEYAPVTEFIAEGRTVPFPSLGWGSPEVYDRMAVGIQGLLTGQTTVDDVLASMDAAWDG